METIIIALFCVQLLLCVVLDISILFALAVGVGLFFAYGLRRGISGSAMLRICLDGIKTSSGLLITFALIGVMTALWRASGTISIIMCCSAPFMYPSVFLMVVFLLNCGISVLTGTAFGTAATMGVICAALGSVMNVPTALVGGAVLSGAYFGDRCSPVSTGALLVSQLTHTSIYANIRAMLKTAFFPFLMACTFYLLLSLLMPHQQMSLDIKSMLGDGFTLQWISLLPALLILVLSLFRLDVKRTMLLSILSATLICLLVQQISWKDVVLIAVLGYQAGEGYLSQMLSGGGVISMAKVSFVVCLSSVCCNIFQKTGMLQEIQISIMHLSHQITSYGAILVTSFLAGAVACNQTLTIMLTYQLCQKVQPDEKRMAIPLENTAVVVAPLIPWSIACCVPLASVNAPLESVLFAVFLYLLPAWRLLLDLFHQRRGSDTRLTPNDNKTVISRE